MLYFIIPNNKIIFNTHIYIVARYNNNRVAIVIKYRPWLRAIVVKYNEKTREYRVSRKFELTYAIKNRHNYCY